MQLYCLIGFMTHAKILYLGDLRTTCTHESGVQIQTDAPKDNQGRGEGFSPTDLVGVSLGSCMITCMAIEARKLGLELKGSTVEVEKEMALSPRRIGRVIIRIRSPLLPNPLAREKLEQAAVRCPVHHSLHPDIKIEVDFIWGL